MEKILLLDAEEPEEEDLISVEEPAVDVRVVRHVFLVNAAFCAVICLWGVVPYFLMRFDASLTELLIIAGVTGTFFVVSYCFLFVAADNAILLSVWMFSFFMLINVSAALLGSFSPFMAVLIVFMQSDGVLIYCLVARRYFTVWWTLGVTILPSLSVWLLGLYAFIEYQNWITSVILLVVFVFGFSLYATYEIYLIGEKRFHLGELVKATSYYYTDVFRIPYKRWIKRSA